MDLETNTMINIIEPTEILFLLLSFQNLFQLSAFMARLLPDKISSSGVSFNLASRGSDLYI